MPQKTIIAIGGGEIGRCLPDGSQAPTSTLAIEREIVLRTGKTTPRVLFIPTASDDHEGYCETVRAHFGGRLGCVVDTLLLRRERLTAAEIERKIFETDVIYVGGGNTLRMMTLWRRLGLDRFLREAYERGVVMSGVSAGAICWFRYGNSDSRKFTSGSDRLIRVTGLGFVDALVCPHYDAEPLRRTDIPRMMRSTRGVAFALDELAAIEIIDDTFRILSADGVAGASRCFVRDGGFIRESIPVRDRFAPIADFLAV